MDEAANSGEEATTEQIKWNLAVLLKGRPANTRAPLTTRSVRTDASMISKELHRDLLLSPNIEFEGSLCGAEACFTICLYLRGGAVVADIEENGSEDTVKGMVLRALRSRDGDELRYNWNKLALGLKTQTNLITDAKISSEAGYASPVEAWPEIAIHCNSLSFDVSLYRSCDCPQLKPPRTGIVSHGRECIIRVAEFEQYLGTGSHPTLEDSIQTLQAFFDQFVTDDTCPDCGTRVREQRVLTNGPPRYIAVEVASVEKRDLRVLQEEFSIVYRDDKLEEKVAKAGPIRAIVAGRDLFYPTEKWEKEEKGKYNHQYHHWAVLIARGGLHSEVLLRDSMLADGGRVVSPEELGGGTHVPALVVLAWNALGECE